MKMLPNDYILVKELYHTFIFYSKEYNCIKVSFQPSAVIEKDQAEEIIIAIHDFAKDNKSYLLVDGMGDFISVDNSAMKAFSLARNKKHVSIATGLIAKGLASRMVGNFYINIHKTKSHTKLFKTEEKAYNWLFKQK